MVLSRSYLDLQHIYIYLSSLFYFSWLFIMFQNLSSLFININIEYFLLSRYISRNKCKINNERALCILKCHNIIWIMAFHEILLPPSVNKKSFNWPVLCEIKHKIPCLLCCLWMNILWGPYKIKLLLSIIWQLSQNVLCKPV